MTDRQRYDYTATERARRRRARGRQVSVTLTDPELITRWDALVAVLGSQPLALTALLTLEKTHAGVIQP